MVAALALAGAACGGDDDSTATDDASATSDAADNGDDSGDEGDSNSSDWCDLSREMDSDTSLFDTMDINDPESVEDAYNQVIGAIEDAADETPDEIKDDVEIVLERIKTGFEALKDADFNLLEVDQAAFEDPEADAASDRIDAYNERECGIESDGAETSTTDDVTDDTGDAVLSGEGTVKDELIRQFTAMGMTEDQANCMVDNLDMDEVVANGANDPSMFLDLFETCDIELTDLQTGG